VICAEVERKPIRASKIVKSSRANKVKRSGSVMP
jgi:hypothetical protein